jgi:very-short-patch-repair endonuclease
MPRFPRHPFAERRAKELRRELTGAEAFLWILIRSDVVAKFRRQEPIGRYICDFVCYRHRIIVELDGSQHAHSTYDEKRDEWLGSQGFTVLRFQNEEMLRDPVSVINTIRNATSPDSDR